MESRKDTVDSLMDEIKQLEVQLEKAKKQIDELLSSDTLNVLEREIEGVLSEMQGFGFTFDDKLSDDDLEKIREEHKERIKAEAQSLSDELFDANMKTLDQEISQKAENLILSVLPLPANIKEGLFKGSITSLLTKFSNDRLQKPKQDSNTVEDTNDLNLIIERPRSVTI